MWTGAFSILCIAIRLIVAAEDDQSEEFSYLNITCEQKLLVREVEIRGFMKIFQFPERVPMEHIVSKNSLDFELRISFIFYSDLF